jgi:DNA-binding NarL/FixJ family response regulator
MKSATKTKVFIADRHPLVLEGLRRILESDTGIDVVGEARNGDEAIRKACLVSPDVIVMDLKMPDMDGISVTREMRRRLPDSRVLILSLDDDQVDEAIEAGASGFLMKDGETEDIAIAVHQVRKGLCPIAPSVTFRLVTKLAELKRSHQSLILTKRETEILQLIAQGMKSAEISERLFVSLSTVKREVGQIFSRLGVNDRPHAVSEAMKQRLI